MIDIHNHILPNVDDGSDSLDKTRKLLIDAINEGITDVCITPHFSRLDSYTYKSEQLLNKFEELKTYCIDLQINLYLGNELMIDKDLDELLISKQLLTLNNSRYVLVEFPFEVYKSEYDEYLYNISISGYKIIIAHPERYKYVIDNPNKYINKWINEGYYLQCNQTSLQDRKMRSFIFNLIENKQLHFIASDAHNSHRPLTLIDAYKLVEKKFNCEVSKLLFIDNPKNVINNNDVAILPKVKRHLF